MSKVKQGSAKSFDTPVQGMYAVYPGQGVGVVAGVEEFRIGRDGDTIDLVEMWFMYGENSPGHRPHSSVKIPKDKWAERVHPPSSRAELISIFKSLRDLTAESEKPRGKWKTRASTYDALIAESGLRGAADVLIFLMGDRRGIRMDEMIVGSRNPKKDEKNVISYAALQLARHASQLIAQELAVVAGIDEMAAREHVSSQLLDLKPKPLWPRGAASEKKELMTEDDFEAFFGLKPGEKVRMPNKGIPSAAVKPKPKKVVSAQAYKPPPPNSLKPQSTPKKAATKKPASAPQFKSLKVRDIYWKELPKVSRTGKIRQAFNIAAEILDETAFEIMARHDFRQKSKQHTLEDIAKDMNLSLEFVRATRDKAAADVKRVFEERHGPVGSKFYTLQPLSAYRPPSKNYAIPTYSKRGNGTGDARHVDASDNRIKPSDQPAYEPLPRRKAPAEMDPDALEVLKIMNRIRQGDGDKPDFDCD